MSKLVLFHLAVAPLGAEDQVEGRQAQHALHPADGGAAEAKDGALHVEVDDDVDGEGAGAGSLDGGMVTIKF